MAAIAQRRTSLGCSLSPCPRISIPSKDDTKSTLGIQTPPNSGNLSPDLQPKTPPVLPSDGKSDEVLQIGKYLLVERTDSNVYTATDVNTGQEKVCKIFNTDNYRSKIAPYCRMDEDSNVVEINEIVKGHKDVYIFFNKHYGDLHSYVRSKKRLKEDEAAALFQQIAQAVAQCHRCGVVIRDLKLRKFIFTDPERTKIQLEGLEDSFILDDSDDDTLRDKQGCPAYVSPEVLADAKAGYSGKASDLWSLGVMLYTMLVGRYPFHESELSKLFDKIRIGNFSIPNWISSKAKCLIKNLLRKEALLRLDADEVMLHPWLKSPSSDKMPSLKDFQNDQQVPS